MKRLFFYYIIPILSTLTISCKDDLSIGFIDNSEGKGSPYLSIEIDTPDTRTRAIDMTPGAPLYLNKIWVGIYRKSDGKRVGGTPIGDEPDLDSRITSSGAKLLNVISVTNNNYPAVTPALSSNDDLCVVGVANYEDIKTAQGGSLYAALTAANTWEEFTNITIDTQQEFINQTPMLMGYLYNENSGNEGGDYIYTKVNQFSTATGTGINLYPFDIETTKYKNEDIYVKATLNGSGQIEHLNTMDVGTNKLNYVLKFRRMRSKINVKIDPKDNIYITGMQYKVINVPKSAFLAQRRTNVFDYVREGFEGTAGQNSNDNEYSPNSADVLEDGNGGGYYDMDWVSPGENTSFSYEHFENKHWAKKDYFNGSSTYHDREKNDYTIEKKEKENEKGEKVEYSDRILTFSALADDPDDWNNKATYMILKMSIRDENKNQNAEVEYVIHEGFCNDKDGISLVKENGTTKEGKSLKDRLEDYSCIRNTDYYYNVIVGGVDDIYTQVTTSGHTYDEAGSIWQINYLKENSNDPNQVVTDSYKTVKASLTFEDADSFDDIAFRLLGSVYDPETDIETPVDICYNFARGELDGFAGLWPAPTNDNTEYIVTTRNENGEVIKKAEVAFSEFLTNGTVNSNNFAKFKNNIKVTLDGSTYIDMAQYVEKLTSESSIPEIKGFGFEGYKLYETEPGNSKKRESLRALYIFDKEKAIIGGRRTKDDHTNNQHTSVTGDEPCSFFYELSGVEQYADYMTNAIPEPMIYANSGNLPADTETSINSFNDNHGGKGILLSDWPDIAFRYLGYDENQNYYDYCYNFDRDDYSYYTDYNQWPEFDSNSKFISKGNLSSVKISDFVLGGLQVFDGSNSYSVADFVYNIESNNLKTEGKQVGFTVNPYDVAFKTLDVTPYRRALYVFEKINRNREPVILSDDGKTAYYQVYAVSQLPVQEDPDYFLLPDISYFNSTNKYNIIEPSLDAVTIPKVTNAELGSFKYRIFAKDNNGRQGKDYEFTPTTNNTSVSIPMWALPGTTGTVYIQAISIDGLGYEPSETKEIGSYNLKSHNTWQSGDNEDWATALNKLSTSETSVSFSGNYLTFDGKFQKDNSGNIQLRGGTISFTVYKPCTISIAGTQTGAASNGSKYGVKISGGEDNEAKYFEDYSNLTVKTTITEKDFEGVDSIRISITRAQGTGTNVKSISVTPL